MAFRCAKLGRNGVAEGESTSSDGRRELEDPWHWGGGHMAMPNKVKRKGKDWGPVSEELSRRRLGDWGSKRVDRAFLVGEREKHAAVGTSEQKAGESPSKPITGPHPLKKNFLAVSAPAGEAFFNPLMNHWKASHEQEFPSFRKWEGSSLLQGLLRWKLEGTP